MQTIRRQSYKKFREALRDIEKHAAWLEKNPPPNIEKAMSAIKLLEMMAEHVQRDVEADEREANEREARAVA